MTVVLITGMSGVGKSTALAELARRGYETVDTDDGDWIRVVGGEPFWDEQRIGALLSAPNIGPVFLLGTVANQGRWYPQFHAIVLLSAPRDVIFERLRTRTTNDFGKTAAERQQIARDIRDVEPLLRVGATHELDTTRPLVETVDRLIEIAGLQP